MPNESNRGGSQEHAEAGEQSRKNPNSGRGWHGDPEGHAEVGRKGGEAVSKNREHMAQIGRKGGEAVSKDREHMAEIGREGGEARSNRTGSGRSSGASRDGSHETRVKAGEQSHKNK